MTGIKYPTITVGEHKDLTVRFSLAAQFLLRRRGIEPVQLGEALAPTLPPHTKTAPPNLKCVENYVILFSCMVAENFLDKSCQTLELESVPTADYWATQIVDFAEVETAVTEALKKAAEERRKKLAAVPPVQTEAARIGNALMA
jgi:hypothetical protein